MPKFRLDIEYEYDFFLLGISCHEKAYRLCWAINRALEINLEQIEPMSIELKKNQSPVLFTVFREEDPENDIALTLIVNKNGNQVLIPEQDQADYFFIVRGPFTANDHSRMLREIKNIPFVLMSFPIDPETLRSRQNLVF
ncbi:MAG: IPExxxVDY family protein [Bacteroidetes bacterium]|nr:IPExxxVDY family protein [Bacteroidota bacterium]